MKNVSEMQDTLIRIRALEGDMTLRRLQVLLEIYRAGQSGIDYQNLIKRLDIGPGNATKLIQSWSARTAQKMKGPAYAESLIDPDNMSTKRAVITERGRRAVEALFS